MKQSEHTRTAQEISFKHISENLKTIGELKKLSDEVRELNKEVLK